MIVKYCCIGHVKCVSYDVAVLEDLLPNTRDEIRRQLLGMKIIGGAGS